MNHRALHKRLCLVIWASTVAAVHIPATGQTVVRAGRPLEVEHLAVAAGGTALLSLLDKPVQRFLQGHRTELGDHLAHGFRQLGEIDVVLPGAAGILLTGLVSNDRDVERAGGQLIASIGLAAVITGAGKFAFGRERPSHPDSTGPWTFRPFTGVFAKAFPSGHTALAFAIATTLADRSTSNITRGLIYAAAAGTGWSRINDNRHWLSDVGFGAVVGLTASRLVTGRWTILGIETPEFFATEDAEPANVGQLALGAALGIGVLQVARLTASTATRFRPYASPLRERGWAVGLTGNF